jgi:hypothetical protein
VTPDEDSRRTPVELSGSQRALRGALAGRSAVLERMYIGGLTVLHSDANPDRFALAAHSLRELIEKLPEHFNVPQQAMRESLKAKVNELLPHWDRARRGSCHDGGVWDGAIDNVLKAFLGRLAGFFDWHTTHHRRRNAEAADALRRFDAAGRALPPRLEALNVEALEEMRDFFQKVAHHRREVAHGEFVVWLDALERFLLDRLVPRTFEDFEQLDQLIDEGSNA